MAADSKPFWKSKTFWANTIMGVGAFLPPVRNHLTPEVAASAITIVNLVLRLISKDKVTLN